MATNTPHPNPATTVANRRTHRGRDPPSRCCARRTHRMLGCTGPPQISTRSRGFPGPAPVAAAYGSGKVTVAVVLGTSGTTGTDAMGPYEVFATSPRFTVYTVAAHDTVAPVEGGPGIVPAYTFDQVETGRAPSPDVVVVPALEHPEATSEAPVRDFVRRHAEGGARILSVCNGAWVLAEAGVLDGLNATAHWSRLDELRQQYPDVELARRTPLRRRI